MKYSDFLIATVLLLPIILFSQLNERPKLVVGIVIDQMRAEYLYRFQDNYTENGFKRLMQKGFNIKNMHYNYVPTYTGPGHASIYTGTTPSNHGIVANDWFDRVHNKIVYCAEDKTVYLVDGSSTTKKEYNAFARSPKNLQSQTITDKLKLFSYGKSKVIGISLKDRGAIMPAGHLADYAFWYNTKTGNFITSSYYANSLPDWLVKFNKKNNSDSLLNSTWKLLLNEEKYRNGSPDDNLFEKVLKGKKTAAFPYGLKNLRTVNGNYALMTEVPFGNTLLTQLALATILGEGLGQNNNTDFLAVSYSSTDYIGHLYGIRSKELEDTYIRLDREIGSLLNYLDVTVGKENYLLFLTADHAASDHPEFLGKSRLPGKFFDTQQIKKNLNEELSSLFGKSEYVAHLDQLQLYLNFKEKKKNDMLEAAANLLRSEEGVKEIYMPKLNTGRNLNIDQFFKKGYNAENSGDILIQFKPGWMPIRQYGTTHGTSYNDDTHVPMLWYGWNVRNGESVTKYTIDQITPTLSMLLNIPLPDTSFDEPIEELFD